ncbi:MAG: hypothetical protein D6737_19290 [Chloroflexi bacterium]|nr:MAG: hypothetical protein D6737_19290 [Chloroflexota bacterium]
MQRFEGRLASHFLLFTPQNPTTKHVSCVDKKANFFATFFHAILDRANTIHLGLFLAAFSVIIASHDG